MLHTHYNHYFESLAEKHIDIRHSSDRMHFARIVLSEDELGQSNVSEFISSLKSKLFTPFMLSAAPENTYEDNKSDNIKKHFAGMFWILDKEKKGNFDANESIYSAMEEIAEDILGRMRKDFSDSIGNRFYTLEESTLSKVGEVQGFIGVRVSFRFFVTANYELSYKANKFTDTQNSDPV